MSSPTKTKEAIIAEAQAYYDEGYACSQAVLLAYAPHFDLDLKTAKLISSTFGGGMGRLRKTCGAVTGSFMVLGLAYGNEDPSDMPTKLAAYSRVRELHQKVEALHGTADCQEIRCKHAPQNEVEERLHQKFICRHLVGEAAGLVYEQLETGNN